MPTYDYECQKCGNVVEVFQKMDAPAPKECPKCKTKSQLKKMIGAGSGLIFKGSGFYVTDYKKKGSCEHKTKDVKREDSSRSKKCPKGSS